MESNRQLYSMLHNGITDEILGLIGLPKRGLIRNLAAPFIRRLSSTFTTIAAGFEERAADLGFSHAAHWIASQFTLDITARGHEEIPQSGPVLIAANHPGAIDALAITGSSKRDDMRIVVSSIPFIRMLPTTSQHMIWTSLDTHLRMLVVRSMIRELRAGRAVLIFPSGIVDPDPDLMPGAEAALNRWSESISIALRSVPETRLVRTIVSGVLDPDLLRHPLTRVRRALHNQQKVAELLHVMRGLFRPETIGNRTRISFAEPVTTANLPKERKAMMTSIIAGAQELLWDHMTTLRVQAK
ncbi:MAG: 1-acyl-sn-glycerol-3-phosphate acyltransferase [Anaerolineales bacterium]